MSWGWGCGGLGQNWVKGWDMHMRCPMATWNAPSLLLLSCTCTRSTPRSLLEAAGIRNDADDYYKVIS